MSPLTPTPKQLPHSPPPPNKDDQNLKEVRSLTEEDRVTPLSLLTFPFLRCRYLPPFSAASVRTLSVLFLFPLSSSSICLHLSVFCLHFRLHWTPNMFSVAPLSFLLSVPPTEIIYLSPHKLFLPLICVTSAIFYPYTPTHPLPLYITPLYFYIYIYLSLLTHFISPLALTHSLSLYIF